MWTEGTRIEGEADRDWAQDDLMLGPCRFIAALFADAELDDAWCNGDTVDWVGACALWHQRRDAFLARAAGTGWGLTILYTRKDIN